ncbi:Nucleic acid-binding, OB-fold [Sesbania bispinosa]|nr:Nucleic acid-binding, OB-fold [Sesbania bispinosa]
MGPDVTCVGSYVAKVKLYKGEVGLQNVLNTTKVLCNPLIPELEDFRNRRVLFIVCASIVTVLGGGNCGMYAACKCHRAVTMDGERYYCSSCGMHVHDVSSRGHTAFVLFDADAEDNPSEEFPPEFNNVAGKEVLFKVEKGADYAFKFDDSFKVRKICLDVTIIDLFKQDLNVATPEARIFPVPFPSLDDDAEENNDSGAEKKPNGGDKCVELSPVSVDDVLADSVVCYALNESVTSDCTKGRGKGGRNSRLMEVKN